MILLMAIMKQCLQTAPEETLSKSVLIFQTELMLMANTCLIMTTCMITLSFNLVYYSSFYTNTALKIAMLQC